MDILRITLLKFPPPLHVLHFKYQNDHKILYQVQYLAYSTTLLTNV
jgi:hypothetical protein